MPQSVQQLPAQVALAIEQRVEDGDRQLYRVMYISKVHPDERDLNAIAMVQCTLHLWALDAADAYALFSNNVPEHYPVFVLISIAPVNPDIPFDSMLDIARGPRAV